jgi:hypothetical protein
MTITPTLSFPVECNAHHAVGELHELLRAMLANRADAMPSPASVTEPMSLMPTHQTLDLFKKVGRDLLDEIRHIAHLQSLLIPTPECSLRTSTRIAVISGGCNQEQSLMITETTLPVSCRFHTVQRPRPEMSTMPPAL